ncbi:MAG: hypothetical protein WCG05_04715 [Alphaproteobacteria bacterium]
MKKYFVKVAMLLALAGIVFTSFQACGAGRDIEADVVNFLALQFRERDSAVNLSGSISPEKSDTSDVFDEEEQAKQEAEMLMFVKTSFVDKKLNRDQIKAEEESLKNRTVNFHYMGLPVDEKNRTVAISEMNEGIEKGHITAKNFLTSINEVFQKASTRYLAAQMNRLPEKKKQHDYSSLAHVAAKRQADAIREKASRFVIHPSQEDCPQETETLPEKVHGNSFDWGNFKTQLSAHVEKEGRKAVQKRRAESVDEDSDQKKSPKVLESKTIKATKPKQRRLVVKSQEPSESEEDLDLSDEDSDWEKTTAVLKSAQKRKAAEKRPQDHTKLLEKLKEFKFSEGEIAPEYSKLALTVLTDGIRCGEITAENFDREVDQVFQECAPSFQKLEARQKRDQAKGRMGKVAAQSKILRLKPYLAEPTEDECAVNTPIHTANKDLIKKLYDFQYKGFIDDEHRGIALSILEKKIQDGTINNENFKIEVLKEFSVQSYAFESALGRSMKPKAEKKEKSMQSLSPEVVDLTGIGENDFLIEPIFLNPFKIDLASQGSLTGRQSIDFSLQPHDLFQDLSEIRVYKQNILLSQLDGSKSL